MKLKSLVVCAVTLFAVVCSVQAQNNNTKTDVSAHTMMPPPPVQNSVFDAMVGSWSGESEMMGSKKHDEVNIDWALNHQYIIMKLMATDVNQPNIKYEGMGVLGVSKNGKVKNWWFDSWGADAMSTGMGVFGDNKLTLIDGNSMFHEIRTFEIKGNEMTMHAKGTMVQNGKKMPFDVTTVYTKK